MLLLDRSSAEIWQMVLPKRNILFPAFSENDDLIFYYRNSVYFVHEDGAVVRMKKPGNIHKLSQEDLWEILFHEKDTFDYDDHGMFSMGAILKDMGFMIPLKNRPYECSFKIEIVNRIDPEGDLYFYELNQVSFQYALYHAFIQCHERNEQSSGVGEYEVQQIDRIDKQLEHVNTQNRN